MKKGIVLCCILLVISPLFSFAEEPFEINTLLMRSTFKIEGNQTIGTCFIMGKPDKNSKYYYYVLITAAHVLENMGDNAIIWLRKKENNQFIKFPYQIQLKELGRPIWKKHPREDVALMYIALPKNADISLLTTDLIVNDNFLKEINIHPGDELFCLGYPLGLEGNSSAFPILRSGKIASYPLLPTKDVRTFLFDFKVFGGNSGGPVYFCQKTRVINNSLNLKTYQGIIGIVIQETSIREKTIQMIVDLPLDVATVVYGSFIKETLELLPPPPVAN